MSKHNYSQYSNKKNDRKPEVVGANAPVNDRKPNVPKSMVEEPVVEPVQVKMESTETIEPIAPTIDLVQETTSGLQPSLVHETVDTVTLPETVKGIVANCAKLNVRANPSINAEIVDVLDVMTEIQIDVNKSNNEWLKIYTATGNEGYCMRKFVEAHL